MPVRKSPKPALFAIGVMLSAMLLIPESASAQVSVSANVNASVTVLAPLQPEILRSALARAAMLPADLPGSVTYDLGHEGAQVSMNTDVPAQQPDGAPVRRRVTISFPGT